MKPASILLGFFSLKCDGKCDGVTLAEGQVVVDTEKRMIHRGMWNIRQQ